MHQQSKLNESSASALQHITRGPGFLHNFGACGSLSCILANCISEKVKKAKKKDKNSQLELWLTIGKEANGRAASMCGLPLTAASEKAQTSVWEERESKNC